MKIKYENQIVGRIAEKVKLKQLLQSNKAEFLAVYGRRRIGKTFLIRNYFDQQTCVFFRSTGIQEGKLDDQLSQFSKQIGETFYGGASISPRKKWLDAFDDINKAIAQVAPNKKIVLFFDEFPWMATKRSDLLRSLEYFWNHHWSQNPRIKIIVCGSSSSWIIDKIINNKGGLYNRVTQTIKLTPFTLSEVEEYFKTNKIKLNRSHILDLYMVLGGIPHYLSFIRPGLTAHQNIDAILFQQGGPLVEEFSRLFKSLFSESEIHLNLIKILSKHRFGLSQSQLIKEAGLTSGGRSIQYLKELEEAGFTLGFLPHGHNEKGMFYKIIDEFTLFYYSWVKSKTRSIQKQDKSAGYWLSKSKSPGWNSWAGYAFEAVCYKHISQIKAALKIDQGSDVGSWRYVPRIGVKEDGAQIDLLFDRPDDAINICEIKYSDTLFAIDKSYSGSLRKKIEIYAQQTRTKKQIFLTLITAFGLKKTKYLEMVTNEVILDDLFKNV